MTDPKLTREQARQLAAGMRVRYQQGSKVVRGTVLDAFCTATGYHRKAAIRLLKASPPSRNPTGGRRRGRPATYNAADQALVRQVWTVSNQSCGKRLAPLLATLLDALERHGEVDVPAAQRARLVAMSAAMIDRLIAPARGPTVGRRAPRPTGRAT